MNGIKQSALRRSDFYSEVDLVHDDFTGLEIARVLLHVGRTSAKKSAINAFLGGTDSFPESDGASEWLCIRLHESCEWSLSVESFS